MEKTDPFESSGASAPSSPSKKEKRTIFSNDEIEAWMKEKSSIVSTECIGIVGTDGTGKSGIALDCRTPEEVEEGKKIIVLDLDGGCIPIKIKYHNNDENIIVKDPTVYKTDEDGTNVDYNATMEKIMATVTWLNNKKDSNIKAVILDGCDKLLKIAEYQMRMDEHIDVNGGVQLRYWNKRNISYFRILEAIKKLPYDKYFITHLKEDRETGKTKPAWEKTTSDFLFSILECKKIEDADGVEFKVHVKKYKGKTELEGTQITFCKINKTDKKVEWIGTKTIGL